MNFKAIRIGLYRSDLKPSKKEYSIEKLKLKYFKLSAISLQEREEVEQIVFYDNDEKQLILKPKK